MDFLGIGIGLPQILLVLVVAMLVLGPERLPEVARQLAKGIKTLRSYASDVQGQFEGEFGDLREEFLGVQNDLNAVRGNLRGGLTDLDTTLRSVDSDVRSAGDALHAPLETTAGPSTTSPSGNAVPEYVPPAPKSFTPVVIPSTTAMPASLDARGQDDGTPRLPDYRPPA